MSIPAAVSGSDRLLPFNEAMDVVGFRSRTSIYSAIAKDPTFPQPVRRGRNQFFLESELLSYLSRLAELRATQSQAEATKLAAHRMVVAKAAKRAAHAQAKGVACNSVGQRDSAEAA